MCFLHSGLSYQLSLDSHNVLTALKYIFYFYLDCSPYCLLLTVGNRGSVSSNPGLLPGNTKLSESTDLLRWNISNHNFTGGGSKRKDSSLELSGSLAFLGTGVTILDLTQTLLGEDDELALVFLKTGNIGGKRLGALVGTTVVDGNTNSSGISGSQTGSLQFLKGESPSETDLGGVTLGGAMNSGAEQLKRSGGDGSGLGGTCKTTGLLLGGLVQVEANLEGATRRLTVLLVAMDVGDDVVVLHHLDLLCFHH